MDDNTQRQTGSVKWFDTTKGFGFIAPDEGQGDVFVHVTNLNGVDSNQLQENTRVEFTVEQGDKGLQAVNVILAESAEVAEPELDQAA
jgi:cold shock protein